MQEKDDRKCVTCKYSFAEYIGMYEYNGEFYDRTNLVCRRYPPAKSFWGTSYPDAIAPCGEYKPRGIQGRAS